MEYEEKELRKKIAKNISELIRTRSKNGADVAEKIGVNRTVVYSWKNGVAVPNGLAIIKLCKEFGCEYEDILGEL